MLSKACSASANQVEFAMSPVNIYVQIIVIITAVTRYVIDLSKVLFLVSLMLKNPYMGTSKFFAASYIY